MAEHLSKAVIRCAVLFWILTVSPLVHAETLADPTRPPAIPAVMQEGGSSAATTGPVLQSVLVSPGRRVAIISGQTVKVGDKFGDALVVEIAESEVVLRSGKELRRLKLFPGIAKRLTSLDNFLLPHFGQTGERSGFTHFDRKLKIFRHFGQANS